MYSSPLGHPERGEMARTFRTSAFRVRRAKILVMTLFIAMILAGLTGYFSAALLGLGAPSK